MDNLQVIQDTLRRAEAIVQGETMRTLSYLGEQCVKLTRDRPAEKSWNDRTGNLRSSVGFVIAQKGTIKQSSDFKQVDGPEKGNHIGGQQGKDFAEDAAKENDSDIALVVVAGMNYAGFVEAKGRDVLSGAELHANSVIDGLIAKTKERINSKLQAL